MGDDCCCGMCTKCHAGKYVVAGAVLFAATWYAKSMADVYFIWYALAAMLVLKGILKLVKPNCPHCEPEAKKAKK